MGTALRSGRLLEFQPPQHGCPVQWGSGVAGSNTRSLLPLDATRAVWHTSGLVSRPVTELTRCLDAIVPCDGQDGSITFPMHLLINIMGSFETLFGQRSVQAVPSCQKPLVDEL